LSQRRSKAFRTRSNPPASERLKTRNHAHNNELWLRDRLEAQTNRLSGEYEEIRRDSTMMVLEEENHALSLALFDLKKTAVRKQQGMIFNERQKAKADFIMASPYAKLSDLLRHELKELAVVWSYYSGKIEGNTYSYVETECLLKDGITSPKRYEDAKMLKNLYNGFITVLERVLEHGSMEIDRRTVLSVHSMLISELVREADKGILRTKPVRITGTTYVPPEEVEEIKARFEDVLSEQHRYANPLERAVFLHCNMARLQPFIDGNKRPSRMVESIVLMNHGIIPVYSTKETDINAYRRGGHVLLRNRRLFPLCRLFPEQADSADQRPFARHGHNVRTGTRKRT